MNGVSLVWFSKVFSGAGIVDIGAAFKRSLMLGLVVMILTVVLSVSAGMAFRKSFRGATFLFYVAIASLIMPSIITSLGIALEFRLLDDFIIKSGAEGWTTAMGLFTSGLGAHLTWTLPFGLLIMFAIFNRFDGRLKRRRATSVQHHGRHFAMWCCQSYCRPSWALVCSALPCPGTNSRAPARRSDPSTPCRSSCRG